METINSWCNKLFKNREKFYIQNWEP